MDWPTLLLSERFYWPPELDKARQPRVEPDENPFAGDSARVRRSSAYRRLQYKTQVLPFPRLDYPRTRLTHTSEVCDIGRRLATAVFQRISRERKSEVANIPNWTETNFLFIVEAACAAHDIGNPPFGHAGEDAIKEWFETRHTAFFDALLSPVHNEQSSLQETSPEEEPFFPDDCFIPLRQEMFQFDGNAQGFRLLVDRQSWRGEGGMQLTLPTLAAFTKYPGTVQSIKRHKYCFYNAHLDSAVSIFNKLGIPEKSSPYGKCYARHPLAYIVEAADDIAYLVADLEDAIRGEVVRFEGFPRDCLERIAHAQAHHDAIKNKDFSARYGLVRDNVSSKLRYLGTHAITALIRASTESFMHHYAEIMSGDFHGQLLEKSYLQAYVNELKIFSSENIHCHPGKKENEVAGFNIIFTLLDLYGDMFSELYDKKYNYSKLSYFNGNLMRVFPWDNYIAGGFNNNKFQSELESIESHHSLSLILVDYISGMTDRYARDRALQLTGHVETATRW